MSDSQVNNSSYFLRTEPELFDKILNNLENQYSLTAKELKERVKKLVQSEKEYKFDQLGLAREKWDSKRLLVQIVNSTNNQIKLTIIASYIEVLESGNLARISLAERLIAFESLLNEFLTDKTITINKEGFEN